jgi:D-tyrosyl-tRNA(Tyr) deacylase
MRIVVQRVSEASVNINFSEFSRINRGLFILLGIEDKDNITDIEWLVNKVLNMRIFNDENGVMNISVLDINGEILVVSQFTLHASTKKGNRPSYIKASRPEIAIPLYEQFVEVLRERSQLCVRTGQFGADMKVSLVNDGPVTILMDSKNKE